MITWSKLKTKPFIDLEDAEKFVRHFKFINPKCKYKAGVSDGDIVVFVISAGQYPPIHIDLGRDEPGMVLQCWEGREWVTVIVDGEVVKSPVKIDQLPAGKYRLANPTP